MQYGLRREGIRKKLDRLRGKIHMIEVHQRISLRNKTSRNLRNWFLIMSFRNSKEPVAIGFITLNSRRENVLPQIKIQPVECVAKRTMVISLMGWIIALVVSRIVISGDIVQH